MTFCKVPSLAWRALLQVAPPKPVWNFHFDQDEAGGMRVPRLGTCGELRGGMRERGVPANLVHHRDFCPSRSVQRERVSAPESAVPAREERVCKLDFLPHLDARDELCLPSRRVVSIT